MPSLIETEISTEEFRRNWARLIQKVYHADPLLCPKMQPMRIISFIEDSEVIKKILLHLGLWETRNHDSPPKKTLKANHIDHIVPELPETVYDDLSQLTLYNDDYSPVVEEQYS